MKKALVKDSVKQIKNTFKPLADEWNIEPGSVDSPVTKWAERESTLVCYVIF